MFVMNFLIAKNRVPYVHSMSFTALTPVTSISSGAAAVSLSPCLPPQVWDAPSYPLCLTTAELKEKALLRLIKLFACYRTG